MLVLESIDVSTDTSTGITRGGVYRWNRWMDESMDG